MPPLNLARLRIAFLAGTLGQGGAERQLYYTLTALKSAGAKLQVLSLTQGEFWEEKIRALGIPVIWVGQPSARLARLGRIVAALRRFQPDLVHSQHLYTNLYATAAGRLLGLRAVGSVRGNPKREAANLGLLGRPSLRLPRLVAANSRAAIREAVTMGIPANRLHFLPNALDMAQFTPAVTNGNGPVRLLTVGRLIPLKRVDCFLAALACLKTQMATPVRGLIVGDGPAGAALRQQAAALDLLPDGVTFTGTVANVSPLYHQADIFVLPSESEGTPNVVLEAMACGLPVVASRVGDVPALVAEGETGFLFEPGDIQTMITAIQKLIQEPQLRQRMGRQARHYVEQHHATERLPAFLSDLYRAALA